MVRGPGSMGGCQGCLHPSRGAPGKICSQDGPRSLFQHLQHRLLASCFPKYKKDRERNHVTRYTRSASSLSGWFAAISACLSSTPEPRKLNWRLWFLAWSHPKSLLTGNPRLWPAPKEQPLLRGWLPSSLPFPCRWAGSTAPHCKTRYPETGLGKISCQRPLLVPTRPPGHHQASWSQKPSLCFCPYCSF